MCSSKNILAIIKNAAQKLFRYASNKTIGGLKIKNIILFVLLSDPILCITFNPIIALKYVGLISNKNQLTNTNNVSEPIKIQNETIPTLLIPINPIIALVNNNMQAIISINPTINLFFLISFPFFIHIPLLVK
jgi:hypothetical protein